MVVHVCNSGYEGTEVKGSQSKTGLGKTNKSTRPCLKNKLRGWRYSSSGRTQRQGHKFKPSTSKKGKEGRKEEGREGERQRERRKKVEYRKKGRAIKEVELSGPFSLMTVLSLWK
jgi:hypothetical protein